MSSGDHHNGPRGSAQKHLEEARSMLLSRHHQATDPTGRQIVLLEPPKKIWPEGAKFLRKEIAPEGYTGRIETVFTLYKNRHRAKHLKLSPTQHIHIQLRRKARIAEENEKTDTAAMKFEQMELVSAQVPKARLTPLTESETANSDHVLELIRLFYGAGNNEATKAKRTGVAVVSIARIEREYTMSTVTCT